MPLPSSLKTHPWVRKWGQRVRCARRDLPRLLPLRAFPALRRWSGRPVGLYETVEEYLGRFPSRGWVKQLSSGGSYERVSPMSASGSLPAQFATPQRVAWPAEKVFFIEDCRYWGFYGGSLISHDDRILYEVSPDVWGPQRHALFSQLKLPPIHRLGGLTAIISTPEASTNYSHWMVDLLPRIELLRQAGYGPDQVDRYLVNLGSSPYCRETLTLAGIPPQKIQPVAASSHYQCDAIVVTSLRAGHWQNNMPGWVPGFLDTLDRRSASERSAPFRRLYLSRRDCQYRRVLNDDAVTDQMQSVGFEVVEAGTLSVSDQIRLYSEAAMIVSSHSSALTNLAFCQSGCRVLEIFSNTYFDSSFWTMATAARCRYAAMTADGSDFIDPSIPYMEGQRQDLSVDLTVLEEAVAELAQNHPRVA
jgi:capsular polysaccharide biosynthesis protein